MCLICWFVAICLPLWVIFPSCLIFNNLYFGYMKHYSGAESELHTRYIHSEDSHYLLIPLFLSPLCYPHHVGDQPLQFLIYLWCISFAQIRGMCIFSYLLSYVKGNILYSSILCFFLPFTPPSFGLSLVICSVLDVHNIPFSPFLCILLLLPHLRSPNHSISFHKTTFSFSFF